MQQINAVVKPYLVEAVFEKLGNLPVAECVIREVKGYGRQKSYLDEYHGSEYSLAFLPKVEITLWVDDAHANDVSQAIVEAARTGRQGDGKVFLLPADGYFQATVAKDG